MIFEPGPDVGDGGAGGFPFAGDVQRRAAEVFDAVVQYDHFVDFVAFFFAGNLEGYIGARHEELCAREC